MGGASLMDQASFEVLDTPHRADRGRIRAANDETHFTALTTSTVRSRKGAPRTCVTAVLPPHLTDSGRKYGRYFKPPLAKVYTTVQRNWILQKQRSLEMAEAIGLGSGIIAFLTVSVQLTTVLFSVWDDLKEAPDVIRSIAGRVEILNFYLSQVQKEEQRLNAVGSAGQGTGELGKIWTSLHARLREDTDDFRDFGERLKQEIDSGSKFVRLKWAVRNKKRVLELDRKLANHLDTFEKIWSLITRENVKILEELENQHFDDTSQALVAQSEQIRDLDSSQTALHTKSHVYLQTIETLTQRSTTTIENTVVSASQRQIDILGSKIDSLDHRLRTSGLVTERFLKAEVDKARGEVMQLVRNIVPCNVETVYTTVSTTQNTVRKSVSVCFSRWNNYRLPIGQLRIFTGSKKTRNSSDAEGASDESFGIQVEFFPASWLANKSIVTRLQYHFGGSGVGISRPVIYYSMNVSTKHEAFMAVEKDDIPLLQRLLGSGLARPNDRDKSSWTLLHKAARWRQPEMCSILIREGADQNATDIWGRTPLHVACDFGVSETVRLLIKNASEMSDPVISAGMRAYATIPSLFNLAIDSMFFRLFEDFTGFEGMDPTVIATILCFQLSGTFKLQPKVLRSWLLSRRPKHLDSAMPTQSLISDELRTMFSSFTKAQMEAMFTAVRHSCRVKSPHLILLLSECKVINSICDDEVDFSLSIATEGRNLIALRILQKMKASLQESDGSCAKSHIQYRGHSEFVKSILDERAFNRVSKITRSTSTRPSDGDTEDSGYRTTVLMFAAIYGDVDVVRDVIETGADIQAIDWCGRTALDHARASDKEGSEAIIELLEEAQKKLEWRKSLPILDAVPISSRSSLGSDRVGLKTSLTRTWTPFTPVHSFIIEWWEYLRQFTWWDIIYLLAGLVLVALGFAKLAMPRAKKFLSQHGAVIKQWSIYVVVAYSMYLVGKSKA